VRLIACTPGLRQVLHRKPALEKLGLQVEADNDVEIIGELVRFRTNQRAFDLVDGAIEGLNGGARKLAAETALQLREIMLPEIAAAAHHIFPKPRLALMHAD